MNRFAVALVLLLMTYTFALTSCDTGEEPILEVPEIPTPSPEVPGSDDSGNANEGEKKTPMNITIRIGSGIFTATLEDNAAAHAFSALLPMTVTMAELNGNEKYHYLDDNLPMDSIRPGTIHNGDLMLFGGNCLVIFYETFSSSYSYTRLGSVDDPSGLVSALGTGDVIVTFEIDKD